MPTEKPRVTITMSEQELEQINDFRFANKMKNQTQAILFLLEKGFNSLQGNDSEPIQQNETKEFDMSLQEQTHIKKYRRLEEQNKQAVDIMIDSLFKAQKRGIPGANDVEIAQENAVIDRLEKLLFESEAEKGEPSASPDTKEA